MDMLAKMGSTLLFTLIETAPYVLIGYFIAAIIREFLPRDFLVRWLGAKGLAPLFKAIGIGSLLPICSCGVVPLSVGLVKCGASKGTVLSFMASAPSISPVSLILGYSLLGPQFMITYVVIILVGSFLIGLLGNRFLASARAGEVSPAGKGFQTRENELTVLDRKRPLWVRIKRAAHWGCFDLGAEISLDLLFGLTLATLVSVLVPASWVATWLGGAGIMSILFVILLSLPIYTCSVPSLPVIQKLVMLGASPGVAIAYLIAGPATNLGELTVVRRAMGTKTMLFYTVGLILISLVGGLLANMLWLDESGRSMISFTARHLGSQLVGPNSFASVLRLLREGGILVTASAVLVFLILLVGSFKKIRLLYVDPCKHCMFWNDVSKSAACPGRCWLKSTQLVLRGKIVP